MIFYVIRRVGHEPIPYLYQSEGHAMRAAKVMSHDFNDTYEVVPLTEIKPIAEDQL